MASELRDDDVGLVVADIVFTFKRQLRDLEKSKAACRPGTTEYRKHCESLFNLERECKKTPARPWMVAEESRQHDDDRVSLRGNRTQGWQC
jgi:hypothetical protein